MTDPAPFLSTMTGASAGLVTIVGGLLVARFNYILAAYMASGT